LPAPFVRLLNRTRESTGYLRPRARS